MKRKVKDRWFYETVPALTVPALLLNDACPVSDALPLFPRAPLLMDDDARSAAQAQGDEEMTETMTKPCDEDWELYYPPWSIHLHPGRWEYYQMESTQEKLRHRVGIY